MNFWRAGMPGKSRVRKILFITHWAQSFGGAEYSLADILDKIGEEAEVHLLTAEHGPLQEMFRLKVRGVVIPCTPGLKHIKRDRLASGVFLHLYSVVAFVVYVLRVLFLVRKLNPDCIHANVPKSHLTLMILSRLGFRGVGILHVREIFTRGSFAYTIYRLMYRSNRTGIIAISDAVRRGLPSSMEKNAVVIYNGVRIPTCFQARPVNLPVRFLYLGRVVPWKGCHMLIEIFEELRTLIAPGAATLRLVGDTSYWDAGYRRDLERLITVFGLAGPVTLEPGTDDPYAVLSRHDVLCVPSKREPFGRVAAEAQSCGMPVIGFSGGGLAEIIVDGETGFLVPDDNCSAFARAMTEFVNKGSLVQEFGNKGYLRAKMHFNRERQVSEIIDYLLAQAESSKNQNRHCSKR